MEDDPDNRETLRILLEQQGYSVTTAEDGLQGLELLEASSSQVALIDIGLPGMSGHELARKIRELPRGSEMFLVALTGYGQKSDREASDRAGFDAHLVKPLDPERLTSVLARAAERA